MEATWVASRWISCQGCCMPWGHQVEASTLCTLHSSRKNHSQSDRWMKHWGLLFILWCTYIIYTHEYADWLEFDSMLHFALKVCRNLMHRMYGNKLFCMSYVRLTYTVCRCIHHKHRRDNNLQSMATSVSVHLQSDSDWEIWPTEVNVQGETVLEMDYSHHFLTEESCTWVRLIVMFWTQLVQTRSAFPIGSAVDGHRLGGKRPEDIKYCKALYEHFNWATPGNDVKWRIMERHEVWHWCMRHCLSYSETESQSLWKTEDSLQCYIRI